MMCLIFLDEEKPESFKLFFMSQYEVFATFQYVVVGLNSYFTQINDDTIINLIISLAHYAALLYVERQIQMIVDFQNPDKCVWS